MYSNSNMILKIKTKINKILTLTILSSFLASFLCPLNIAQATEYNFDSDTNQEVWQLNQDINEKRSQITELKRQVDIYKKNITAKQRELTKKIGQEFPPLPKSDIRKFVQGMYTGSDSCSRCFFGSVSRLRTTGEGFHGNRFQVHPAGRSQRMCEPGCPRCSPGSLRLP